jgi:protease-4
MRFLGNILSTVIGIFVFLIIAFFGIILLGALFGGDNDEINVKSKTVIELDLENINLDYTGKFTDPIMDLISKNKSVGLTEVLNAIEAAKNDDKIEGISMVNTFSMLGMAQTKALRDQLLDFKASGKFVVAYADYFTQGEYYLNSVADTLYINPVGMMDFKGLASEVLFFKDIQDKTGFKMEIIRHGKYKSAVEPFLSNEMSDENRQQITELLNSVWGNMIAEISESRNISLDSLNSIANRMGARTPQLALATQLVDKIGYEDEFHNGIRKALEVAKEKPYNIVSISDYAFKVSNTPQKGSSKEKIAIIYAQGEILGGEGNVNVIGEGSMRAAIRSARRDENIKAIVLRVDSPGGSALTSELIWREIELTKKVKPIVVSMGNYAASGGYYIACNANKIFAEANTITGSIGVFGVLPNFTVAADKIGLDIEQVKTHTNAAGYSPFMPLDENFRGFAQEGVEKIYSTFVNRVIFPSMVVHVALHPKLFRKFLQRHPTLPSLFILLETR